MLIKNLPVETIPSAAFSDSVYRVLNLMQDHRVAHIAVQSAGKFAGTISENILLEVDEESSIEEVQHLLQNFSVKENDHFLKAVSLSAAHNISVIPVVDDENNLNGSILATDLLAHVAQFLHLQEAGAMIVLEIDPQHYSFSEISKLIESNDAQVTQLNTSRNSQTGLMLVTIRLNKLEVSDIVATFQRYEYNVKYYSGEEQYTNELKSNYENLMNYLNI